MQYDKNNFILSIHFHRLICLEVEKYSYFLQDFLELSKRLLDCMLKYFSFWTHKTNAKLMLNSGYFLDEAANFELQ